MLFLLFLRCLAWFWPYCAAEEAVAEEAEEDAAEEDAAEEDASRIFIYLRTLYLLL